LTLLGPPFGKFLLAFVTVGLTGYALWWVVQALADVDRHVTDGKGRAIRGGLLVSDVTSLRLA
jgi:hypothetical protein